MTADNSLSLLKSIISSFINKVRHHVFNNEPPVALMIIKTPLKGLKKLINVRPGLSGHPGI